MTPTTRNRRKKLPYFERREGTPAPLTICIKRRVLFGDADPMGILWHGRYAAFFEAAAVELHRACGLGYDKYHEAALRAPIAQLHIDYLEPVFYDEEVMIQASIIWNDAARLDTEFAISKVDGRAVARGYTIQLFTDAETGEALLASPEMLCNCRAKWLSGELSHLQ